MVMSATGEVVKISMNVGAPLEFLPLRGRAIAYGILGFQSCAEETARIPKLLTGGLCDSKRAFSLLAEATCDSPTRRGRE